MWTSHKIGHKVLSLTAYHLLMPTLPILQGADSSCPISPKKCTECGVRISLGMGIQGKCDLPGSASRPQRRGNVGNITAENGSLAS